MGKMLVEQLVLRCPNEEIVAVGTNTVATGAMLKAGAAHGATGENHSEIAREQKGETYYRPHWYPDS